MRSSSLRVQPAKIGTLRRLSTYAFLLAMRRNCTRSGAARRPPCAGPGRSVLALVPDGFDGGRRGGRVEVLTAGRQRSQVVVEVVPQGDAGGHVEPDDVG